VKAEKELAHKVEELESQLSSAKDGSQSVESKLNSLKEKLTQETERNSQVLTLLHLFIFERKGEF